MTEITTPEALAQEIRRVDGAHSLGAGALAEALLPWINARPDRPSDLATEVERLRADERQHDAYISENENAISQNIRLRRDIELTARRIERIGVTVTTELAAGLVRALLAGAR